MSVCYVCTCVCVCACVCVCVCVCVHACVCEFEFALSKIFCLLVQVMELIDEYNAREKFVAAVIVEPIQAEGGEFELSLCVLSY